MCRFIFVGMLLIAGLAQGAEERVTAVISLDGKKQPIAEKEMAPGVKATVTLLESCTDVSPGTITDLTRAQAGNHIRFHFPSPIKVNIAGESLSVSEIVLTQPLNTGVFWLRSGDKVIRCTKYQFKKLEAYQAWQDRATESR